MSNQAIACLALSGMLSHGLPIPDAGEGELMAIKFRRLIPGIIGRPQQSRVRGRSNDQLLRMADAQSLSTYSSQGWDVTDPPQTNDPSGFITIAAGDPFYTGVDAIYAPYGTAWFVQIHVGTSFIPDGDTVTIAALGADCAVQRRLRLSDSLVSTRSSTRRFLRPEVSPVQRRSQSRTRRR